MKIEIFTDISINGDNIDVIADINNVHHVEFDGSCLYLTVSDLQPEEEIKLIRKKVNDYLESVRRLRSLESSLASRYKVF